MGEGKEILKFDGGEEIKPFRECTYLGTKIVRSGDNTTEIIHRISPARKVINALNSILWHKNITENRKLYIYKTLISEQFCLWCRSMANPYWRNKILYTEMDELRRSARKSKMERIKNGYIKEIMGVKGKPDTIDIIEQKRLQWYGHVKRMPEERIPKLIMDWIPRERRK